MTLLTGLTGRHPPSHARSKTTAPLLIPATQTVCIIMIVTNGCFALNAHLILCSAKFAEKRSAILFATDLRRVIVRGLTRHRLFAIIALGDPAAQSSTLITTPEKRMQEVMRFFHCPDNPFILMSRRFGI
jgi:hypothetical protein